MIRIKPVLLCCIDKLACFLCSCPVCKIDKDFKLSMHDLSLPDRQDDNDLKLTMHVLSLQNRQKNIFFR
jgi:hypothetical protein